MDRKDSLKAAQVDAERNGSIHIEAASVNSEIKEEVRQVTNLTAKEQYKKLWTAMKADSTFVRWTLYSMLLVFGWGYDQSLSGVAIAFPAFREYYGEYYAAAEDYVIPATWQSLWNAASTIGQVFGGYAAGQFADVWGRKILLWASVILSQASSCALVLAPNLPVLFVSKLLLGISVGLATAIPPLYVTENAPAPLRSTASSLTNVIIVLGYFCSVLTGFGASHISGIWSFRTAFLMTFVVPTLYLCGLYWLPESPVYYMKKGREADARKAALKLFGQSADIDSRIEAMKQELQKIERANATTSQTSWKAIFSKEHRGRTFVATLGLQSQNFSGGYFANTYQTYYFELIGQHNAFALTAISAALQFISNLVAVLLSDVIPRRKGLIGGGTLLMGWSVIIAGTSMAPVSNTAAVTALLAFMITWSMLFTASVGCYGWAVAQETAAQATRPKTLSFSLICQQLTALMLSSVFPYFINPDQLNFGGKVMFLFVGVELFIMTGLYFCQPETKNRTNTDIEILFDAGIPARKFSQYAVVDGLPVKKERKNGLVQRLLKR